MADSFYGLATRSLASESLRVDFLAEAGPRVVRLFLAGSNENLLAELPDVRWDTPYGAYHARGGHRLWHAPEAFPRSSIPDDTAPTIEEVTDGVRLVQPTEEPTGVQKVMEIHLHGGRPALTLEHRLGNEGPGPVELAPWAITQLPLGGVAVLPQRAGRQDCPGLNPDRHLVAWPYTHWQDPRLLLRDDYLLVRADPWPAPWKMGYFNRLGWVGYLRREVFFCKRFDPCPGKPHADLGCNVEVYCNDLFVELETLGPLCRLEPGESTSHVERWEFYSGLGHPEEADAVWDLVAPLVRERQPSASCPPSA